VVVPSELVEPVVDRLGSYGETGRRVLDGEQELPHVLEDSESELRGIVRTASGVELGEPGGEDVGAVEGFPEKEEGFLVLGEELLGGGAVLSETLPGGDGAEGEVFGGLEEGALGVAVVEAASGRGEDGTEWEIVLG
jgi:hypothetical protein